MAKRILDTSVLLRWWNLCRSRNRGEVKAEQAESWGRELSTREDTTAIVTPVLLEILGGATGVAELRLMRAFLRPFRCVDEQRVTPPDWQEAIRLAQRVPPDKAPRDFGDCLIRAIANRLKHRVLTLDKRFPR